MHLKMAHFAKIQNNIVKQVVVISNDEEHRGQDFLVKDLGLKGTWIQTSYNKNIRKNFAGIGYTYDSVRDAFVPPKPYNSWLLNEDTCQWEAPSPHPTDEFHYDWNEKNLIWEKTNEL
jgi:hypothetical protein